MLKALGMLGPRRLGLGIAQPALPFAPCACRCAAPPLRRGRRFPRVTAFAGSLCLVAALAVAGCGSAPGAPVNAPRVLADPSSINALAAKANWSVSLASPLTVSVAGDASGVAGSAAAADGGETPWALTASGEPIALGGASGGAVLALSGGVVVVGPGVSDQPGALTVLTQAKTLWTESAIGPIAAAVNAAGTRLAVMDSGTATATELQIMSDGSAQRVDIPDLRSLGAAATVQFDDRGEVLVGDAQHAALYSAQGEKAWSIPLKANTLPREFVLDRDGAGVTAATSGSDNTLYQFAVTSAGKANVAWSQALASGGSNQLIAGPDGHVAVLGIGGPATFAAYREQDGTLLWQDTLPTPAGASAAPVVTGLAFGPGDGVAVAVTGCDAAGSSCILVLDAAGRSVGRVQLQPGVQITLAGNGAAAAVVTPGDASGAPSRLTWLSLAALWPSSAGAATSAT